MSYRTSQDFAQETSWFRRMVQGMIRRVVVTLTEETRWQFRGQVGGSGGDDTFQAEPFTGIGFYARPPATGNPEAIAVGVGGSRSTVVVATRDEATRRASVGDLADGETAVYNDKAVIVVKADGRVEIRLVGGAAVPLATKADLDALITAYNIHVHPVPGVTTGGSATTSTAPTVTKSASVGTSILRGQ